MGFLACTAGAAVCFLVAFLTLPLLAIKPRKFAVAFSLGSILFMGGFCVLQGPVGFFKHLTGAERLPFTAVYVGSLAATLYFAIGQQAYLFTLIAGLAQIAALVSFLFAYFPCVARRVGCVDTCSGGFTTLRYGASMAARGAGSLLPV